MATEINTSVGQEMNITHRRNDSFELQVSVTDSSVSPITSFDLSNAQSGANPYPTAGIMPVYQGKMTIKKRGTQHEAVNIYSYYWRDSHGNNIIPTLIQTGNYFGEKVGGTHADGAGNQDYLYSGIYMLDSVGTSADENIYIKAPSIYMSFDPGEYVYDLQIRRKDVYSSSDVGAVYTTWLFGTFTLIEDVTQV